MFFKIAKKSPDFWTTLVRKFVTKTVQRCPMWSHELQQGIKTRSHNIQRDSNLHQHSSIVLSLCLSVSLSLQFVFLLFWHFSFLMIISLPFVKNGTFPASFFFIFVFSKQPTVSNNCQWRDLNCGSLASEAIALPTVPQPLPFCSSLLNVNIGTYRCPHTSLVSVSYFSTIKNGLLNM